MRSLSGTLLEAQRSASGSPYVRVEVVERVGGVARLMWERIYQGGEGDCFHAAATADMSGTGYIYRMMVDPDTGECKYQRVEASEDGEFDTWYSYSPAVDAYAVACCGCDDFQYGFRMFRIDPSGRIYRARYGGAWQSMGDVGGDSTFRLAAAFKAGTGVNANVVLYSDGADVYLAACDIGGSGWGAFNKWTNASLNSITGLAVCYAGDYNVVLAGVDADGRAGVWQCVYGDGYSAAVGTWSALRPITTASPGSDISFHFPSLDYPDVFRCFYVEAYAGDEAYSRPYWSHSLPAADFISNLWREPVPFNLDSDYGVALGYHGSCAWLSRPGGVWRAPLVPASVELTADVVQVKASAKPCGGGVEIALRNDDGRYNGIGEQGNYEAIKEGSEILLSFGYRTPAGEETGGLEPASWIAGWEYVTRGGSSRLELRAADGWSLLERWIARNQKTWEAGTSNVFQILAWIFARAGLELSSFSSSSAMVDNYPAFTINPGMNGKQAVMRLLARLPDVIFFVGDCGYIVNPTAAEASDYSYGDPADNFHAIHEALTRSSIPAINRAQAEGPAHLSEDFDWSTIALVNDIVDYANDVYLTTQAKADARSAAMLRKAAVFTDRGHITTLMNCGQDLFDVVKITCPEAGLSATYRRVIGLTKRYTRNKPVYTTRLELGER